MHEKTYPDYRYEGGSPNAGPGVTIGFSQNDGGLYFWSGPGDLDRDKDSDKFFHARLELDEMKELRKNLDEAIRRSE
ncbi:MAG: hypothetical protein C0508_05085 [Cyanobacteria bacterium PR.023]|nr:hypothetical protein [Cyanobacteria bacterium PR.023]